MRILNTFVAMFALTLSMPAAELRTAKRVQNFARDLAGQPLARYQAGSVFSRDSSLSTAWVENLSGTGASLEIPLALQGADRILISDVAVSFEGAIAVSGSAGDKEAGSVSVIAWLAPDGSLTRIVRTAPFIARKISFTGDGDLWALGAVKDDHAPDGEAPLHDILRQYNAQGVLVGKFLPRLTVSTAARHPAHRALLLTSRDRVAFISDTARKWAVLAADVTELGQGSLASPENFRTIVGTITDSGRVFMSGQWEGGSPSEGSYPPVPLFELDQQSGELELVDTRKISSGDHFGHLLGSEGDELVFLRESVVVWRDVR
jgi:hypothetical protein